MRLLVCGGRDYRNRPLLFDTLDSRIGAIHLIISGGASGADDLATEWARARCVPYMVFPANWEKYGNRAGPMRNLQMLMEGKPDFVLAFPGGKGTANMVRLAQEAKVEVRYSEDYPTGDSK